jgi:replicative DNA helicase
MRKHNLIGLDQMKRTDPTYDIKILKVILNDPQFLTKIRKDITPELFERQAMAMCYKLIKAHSFINNIDDLVQCVEQLDIDEQNKQIILEFIEELKQEYVGNEDIIKNFALKTFKFKQTAKAVKKLYEKTSNGIIPDESDFKEIIELQKSSTSISMSTPILTPETWVKEEVEKLSTGIPGIDLMYNGGIERKKVMLYIMPSDSGKSTILCMAAMSNVLDNKYVLHITVEDDRIDINRKYVSILTGIPISDINENISVIDSRYKSLYKDIMEGNMKVVDTQGEYLLMSQLETYIEDFIVEKGSIDMIIIDYIDKLKATDKLTGFNENADHKNVATGLLSLAIKYNVGIITASQINRGGDEKEWIHVSDVQGSVFRIQNAQYVISVATTTEFKKVNAVNVLSLKAKDFIRGPRQYEHAYFDPNKCVFDCFAKITVNEALDND